MEICRRPSLYNPYECVIYGLERAVGLFEVANLKTFQFENIARNRMKYYSFRVEKKNGLILVYRNIRYEMKVDFRVKVPCQATFNVRRPRHRRSNSHVANQMLSNIVICSVYIYEKKKNRKK